MANNNTLFARLVNIHDIEANWNRTFNFIPRAGEIIVYDPDTTYSYSRFKVGDGLTDVKNLPFVHETTIDAFAAKFFGSLNDDVVYLNAGNIKDY